MPIPYNKARIGAALIAAVLASAGGIAFIHRHPNPTLREVYAACEKGDLSGSVCCEDTVRVTNSELFLHQCGEVVPNNPDPFGMRQKLEDDFDARLAAEQKAQ